MPISDDYQLFMINIVLLSKRVIYNIIHIYMITLGCLSQRESYTAANSKVCNTFIFQDWFSRQQLVMLVLFINISLALMFIKLLT